MKVVAKKTVPLRKWPYAQQGCALNEDYSEHWHFGRICWGSFLGNMLHSGESGSLLGNKQVAVTSKHLRFTEIINNATFSSFT